MFVYYVASFAFGDALYTMSRYHQKYRNDPNEVYLTGYAEAFSAGFSYMLASIGTLNNAGSLLAFSLYQLCSIFIYIVLLNILIAFICNAFVEISQS